MNASVQVQYSLSAACLKYIQRHTTWCNNQIFYLFYVHKKTRKRAVQFSTRDQNRTRRSSTQNRRSVCLCQKWDWV